MPIESIDYDGEMITLRDQDGRVVTRSKAVSGAPGYSDPAYQGLRDLSPIPEGRYTIKPSEVDFRDSILERLTWSEGWGNGRTPLTPQEGTDTLGRDGFFLHGSLPPNGYGSAGCVDLNEDDTRILELIKEIGDREITFNVDYSNKRTPISTRQTETPPHVNNNGQPSPVSQFTNPQNSPNPADRLARGDNAVNDTYRGQTSGPNRGLGDGGNKASDNSNKAPSNKLDASYFGDLGGGGSGAWGSGVGNAPASAANKTHGTSGKAPSNKSDGSYYGDISSDSGRGARGHNKTDGSKSSPTRKSESPPHADKNRTDHESSKSKGKSDGGGRLPGADPNGVRTKGDPTPGKYGKPILLDLDGDGIEIMELSRSNVFVDSGGDGLLHRTAWAGAGDGVLFFDANGDNRIGEKREYVFTEWDPAAASDLAALRSYFDRNGDGKLTAADPAFARFKVMVTNADGSQTARTLAQLGIQEIALTGDATHITLPDGSVITGQSSFTRTNGTTGTVADVMLVSDAEGRRVVQTVTVDGAGTRTVVSQAYDADGSLAYTITSVTSPDGFSASNAYDEDRVSHRSYSSHRRELMKSQGQRLMAHLHWPHANTARLSEAKGTSLMQVHA